MASARPLLPPLLWENRKSQHPLVKARPSKPAVSPHASCSTGHQASCFPPVPWCPSLCMACGVSQAATSSTQGRVLRGQPSPGPKGRPSSDDEDGAPGCRLPSVGVTGCGEDTPEVLSEAEVGATLKGCRKLSRGDKS